MPKVACSGCDTKVVVPDQYVGTQIRCPKCRMEFVALPGAKPGRNDVGLEAASSIDQYLLTKPVSKSRPVATSLAVVGNRTSRPVVITTIVTLCLVIAYLSLLDWTSSRRVRERQAEIERLQQSIKAVEARLEQSTRQNLPDASGPKHGTSIEEMMSYDSIVTALSEKYPSINFKIRKGEYPREEIEMLILTGKISAADAEDVRQFCEEVRYKHH